MSRTIRLTAAITQDGDWYVARCLDVEVASQGRTIDEALANLREALELYFEDEPAPDGPEPIVAPVEIRLSA
ncbi:MAG TPA: type II toxin-antitoxin system HicB family antitoxin [Streptosporangiaceae bacterium]|jgi:predicted RNase H-like HicB family nuclease